MPGRRLGAVSSVLLSVVVAIEGVAQTSPTAVSSVPVRIRTYPTRPLIEQDGYGQYLHFDFGLDNGSDTALSVTRIELSVFDPAGRLVRRQFVWADGAASPALKGVDRVIPAHGGLSLFNPFHTLPPNLRIGRLQFQFIFAMRGLEAIADAMVEVTPIPYDQPISMLSPVDGPALVYDGHEIYSHHRRIPLGDPRMAAAGFTANPVRYANDLTLVGPRGELARGPLDDPRGWYGYGAVVRAPAAGEVVAVASDVPDNQMTGGILVMGPDPAPTEMRQALGNHVIIRHGDSLYSTLAHLKPGSLSVKPGDRVRAGQVLGEIGFSGDTGLHVHLHHMVTAGMAFNSEGRPIYYDRIRRIALPRGGAARGAFENRVRLDTGDLFESSPR